MLLKGRTAIITGASRGIGRGIAEVFVEQGAKLVISGTTPDVHVVAAELSRNGGVVHAVQGDLREESHQKELVKLARQHFKTVDCLVNNAGQLALGRIGMTTMTAARAMMEINVLVCFNLIQLTSRLMGESPNPSIVNLASIAGTHGMEGVTAYSASKGAVVAMTLAAAKELAPKIRVNAIAPGFVQSRMTEALSGEWFNKRLESVRLGRIGTPRDIGQAACFLASDMASYVTGQILGVDGGMTA